MNSEFNEDDYMSSTFLDDAQNLDYERNHYINKKRLIKLNEKEKEELMFHKINEDNVKPLNSKNKGFQMLKKMGFKQGEKLGVNNNGLEEPIMPNIIHSKRKGLGNIHYDKHTNSNQNENKSSREFSKSNLLSSLHYNKINKCKFNIIKSLKILTNLLEGRFPEITSRYYKSRKVIIGKEEKSKELEEFVDNIMLMKTIIEKDSMTEDEIESYFDYLNLTLEKFEKINMKENLIIKLKEKINSRNSGKTSCIDIIKSFYEIESYLNEFNDNIVTYINKNLFYCTFCQTQYSNYEEFSITCFNCDFKEDDE